MNYAIRVVNTEDTYANLSDWFKTDRGYETWCDSKKLYSNINDAYSIAESCNNRLLSSTYYEVWEVEE